jgi:hypothetical protein
MVSSVMRDGLMMVVLVVGCGGRHAQTQTHRNADPPFELDIPAGFTAQPVEDDPPDGKRQTFRGSDASHYLDLEWGPGDGDSAVELRDGAQAGQEAIMGVRAKASGDLPGGGAWLETEFPKIGVVAGAWLKIGDAIVVCTGQGSPEVTAACKSLRPAS